ncbi:hypothetical protein TcasGA2_TC007405 [Tribolium castaneum]|uniref:Uncharacterized protein n=1 Tax=Tribolium castaneum TaxID=7070 RepID=D1ZZS8_TRICA|nr:hypothetical protein TcasGA2_TC007405 [Tribolium castaneum]
MANRKMADRREKFFLLISCLLSTLHVVGNILILFVWQNFVQIRAEERVWFTRQSEVVDTAAMAADSSHCTRSYCATLPFATLSSPSLRPAAAAAGELERKFEYFDFLVRTSSLQALVTIGRHSLALPRNEERNIHLSRPLIRRKSTTYPPFSRVGQLHLKNWRNNNHRLLDEFVELVQGHGPFRKLRNNRAISETKGGEGRYGTKVMEFWQKQVKVNRIPDYRWSPNVDI